MKTLEKLWKIIDGNKTIICTIVMFILQLEEVEDWMNPAVWKTLTYVFGTLFAGSLYHHVVKKGKLKTTES